eukprot:CAMPEP_0183597918 /NCGR_PEP_ID=MMETSP0371-20130417/177744_1 /TAXON_ID=268820 /ORGANISM="Peridinium aciculiferum, Strain PAER-2" /LENGTH=84 /DNA_ID=CAMNT_0025809915 /DNA_START=224 /DNA_END=474 /DNA_ORIENTATION=+
MTPLVGEVGSPIEGFYSHMLQADLHEEIFAPIVPWQLSFAALVVGLVRADGVPAEDFKRPEQLQLRRLVVPRAVAVPHVICIRR